MLKTEGTKNQTKIFNIVERPMKMEVLSVQSMFQREFGPTKLDVKGELNHLIFFFLLIFFF